MHDTIAEAMNTYNPALAVLRAKGFDVWHNPNIDGSPGQSWYTRKGRRRFVASDPLCLLGLVAMWEQRGDDWQLREDEPDYYDEIRARAYAALDGGAI